MRNRGGLAWVTLLGLLVLGGAGCGSTVPDEVSEEPPPGTPPPVCTPGVDACPAPSAWLWYPELPSSCTSEQVTFAEVLDLAMDGAGNSLVVGSILKGTVRLGSTSLTGSERGMDLFVAKVDAAGVSVWGKLLKVGGGRGGLLFIETDRDGNVLVAGVFTGSLAVDDVTLTAGSGSTPFVVKLSPSGTLLWAQRFEPVVAGASVWGLSVDSAGNVALAGSFEGTLKIGGAEHSMSARDAVYVTKLAASTGEPLWSRSLQHTTWLDAVDVALDAAGDVLFVGSFGTKEGTEPLVFDGTVLTTTGASAEVFVAKLEGATGRARWLEKIVVPPSAPPPVPSVNVDSAGNAWVLIGISPASLVLTKLDGAGHLLASSRLVAGGAGGYIPHLFRPWRVAFEPSGSLVLAGQGQGSVDFGGGGRELGEKRLFVARYDANGAYVTDRFFGDASGFGVAADASGNVVVGGTFVAATDFGSGPVTPCGFSPFLLKYDPTP